MDSKGRNVIVCDNGTGVRIETIFFPIYTEKNGCICVNELCFGMGHYDDITKKTADNTNLVSISTTKYDFILTFRKCVGNISVEIMLRRSKMKHKI